MSHATGTYLGGIRTIECLRKRSRVDSETGCWHWALSCCEGFPRLFVPDAEGKSRKSTAGAAVHLLLHGKPVPEGKRGYRMCQVNDCVNPVHYRFWTRKEHGAWISKKGTWKNQPNRIVANTANRRKGAKLSQEKAREIRASTETQQVLAERYGVPQSTIWAVKRGKLWRESAANSSVFTWRA